MSWWKNIFGGTNPVADVVVDTVKGVSDVVERYLPGDAKSHEMNLELNKVLADNVAKARAATQSVGGTTPFAQALHAISEFVNHLMAPALSVFVCCVLFGAIRISTSTTDPLILTWGEAVGAYWLGARALARDIPQFLKMLVELRRAK